MRPCGWDDCPVGVRGAVEGFVAAVATTLGPNLVGVYLHGSLAMNCFNPARSDVDLLVVTRHAMEAASKRRIAATLLRVSNAPRPIEISFVHRRQIHPWQYPTPFDLHYSEGWRSQTARQLADGTFSGGTDQQRDPDLAAHITITRARGIVLAGPPARDVFAPVPRADYLDAIWRDVDTADRWIGDNVVYGTLNLCRVYAVVRDGLVCSKDEGGVWALRKVEPEHRRLIGEALEAYRGERDETTIDPQRAVTFAQAMLREIEQYRE